MAVDTFTSIWSRNQGRDFVVNYVARVMLGAAIAFRESLGGKWDEEAESTWSLACVLVLWYSDQLAPEEAKAVRSVFTGINTQRIAIALVTVRDGLLPFLAGALSARSSEDLRRAAVPLQAGIERIGADNLSALLHQESVQDLLRRTRAKLPMPQGLTGPYEEALGGNRTPEQPTSDRGRSVPTAPGRRVNRADDFDREPRRAQAPVTRPEPPPVLEPSERLVAVLYTRGWKPEDIEEITKGPRRS